MKISTGNKMKPDNSAPKYTLGRFFLVLALSILACKLLLTYLFQRFPQLHTTDIPLVSSAILAVLLSPVLYAFFYRPIIMQFDKLKGSELKMRELALKDILTGLYNRRGFLTFADHLLKLSDRAHRGLILIYADLDNLKQINDDHGHEEGDRALVIIADVFKETFRDSDVMGRVGGDEFAILALEASAENLDALRKRLKENLEKAQSKFPLHRLTFSLGIVHYDPQMPQSIEELLKKADMLMYEEKTLGHYPTPLFPPSRNRISNFQR